MPRKKDWKKHQNSSSFLLGYDFMDNICSLVSNLSIMHHTKDKLKNVKRNEHFHIQE